jgi:hypothetical protein
MKNNDYYNKERKVKFIELYASKKNELGDTITDTWKLRRVETVFRKLSVFEYRYDKDFCELKPVEDENFTKDIYREWLGNLTSQTSRNWTSVLRAYIEWCQEERIITPRAYAEHPFYSKYRTREERIEGCSLRSAKAVRTIKTILEDDIEPDAKNDFVFSNENDFFDYVKELFDTEDGQYIMYAVICCLLYYGFSHEEIPEIKRIEVDEQKKTVRRVLITNDKAFEMICKAKHADQYTVTGTSRTIKYSFPDTAYLLRTRKTLDKVNASYIRKLLDYEDKAAKDLPTSSKYKNIRIKGSTISKLATFYQMRNEEESLGSNVVKSKIENKEYKEPISYQTYWLMLAKAKQIK